MAKAIRDTETGNRAVPGATGELASRYQFMPATWKAGAAKYLGDSNAPVTLENENKVAYSKIKDWKDQGLNPGQIAAAWNAGPGSLKNDAWKTNIGYNNGVKYDTPAYVQKVYSNYQKYKPQEQPAVPSVAAPKPKRGIMDIASDVVVGGLKGIGSTVSGLESLGEKLLTRPIDRAVSAITGKPSVLPTTGPTTGEQITQQYLQPTTTAQKVGKGAEQIAELFLPTGLEKAGATAAARLAPEASKLASGALKLGGRALGGAAEFGGKTAIQTGGDLKATGQAALLGGVTSGVGGLISEGAAKLAPKLEESAARSMTQALGPTTKTMKLQAEKVVPGLIDRGFKGITRSDLAAKSAASLEKATEELNRVIDTIPPKSRIPVRPILKSILDAKAAYIVDGVAVEPKAVKALNDMAKTVKELGPNVSFESLRALRQILDKAVSKSKGFLMDEVGTYSIAAKREATNAIRSELAKRFPDLAKVNAEYSFWRNVDDILNETLTRTAGQSKPLGEQLLGAAGAAGGLARGGITGAVTGAVVMSNLRKAMTSAGWRTVSAAVKNDLAKALANNELEKAMAIIARIIQGTTIKK